MTVDELIEKLKEFPQDVPVMVDCTFNIECVLNDYLYGSKKTYCEIRAVNKTSGYENCNKDYKWYYD